MYKIVRLFRILFENLFIDYKNYDKSFNLTTNDTLISFNIRADHPRDNKTNWVYRRNSIIEMIKDKRPSIICMQEVQPHMFKWLYKRLYNQYECVEYNSNKNHGSLLNTFSCFGNGMVIWYDRNKFILNFTDCTHANENNTEKFIMTCDFLRKKDNQKISVINTHYSLVYEERITHTSLLNETISQINNDVYVCGDFNDTYNSQSVKNVNLPHKIPSSNETQRTFNHFDDTWGIIDFIMSNKEIKTYEIITKDYGVTYISDHYPIEIGV